MAAAQPPLSRESACEPQWRSFYKLHDPHALYSTGSEYEAWGGIGLGKPASLMGTHVRDSGSREQLLRLLPANGSIGVGECTVADSADPTATWYTEMIGPFSSTGGYDFWQFSWGNAIFPFTGEVDITAEWDGPVDTTGNGIPLPPLHEHHIFIGPSPGAHFQLE